MRFRSDLAWAGVTLAGVPAAMAAMGGSVTYAGAVPMAVALAGLLLLRRRWPVTVLLLSVSIVMGYRIGWLIDVGWVWPATAAVFTVASGPRRHGMLWAMGAVAVPLVNAPFLQSDETGPVDLGFEVLWMALVLAAAGAYRNWRGWQAETAARVAQLERERDLEAQRTAAQERLSMARELHDVVAHTLTVVGVQLRVADEALEDSPQEAQAALKVAQEVRGKAMADLRWMVDVLREQQPLMPQGDLSGLEELIQRTRGKVLIDFDLHGDPGDVPAPVALAVYRVVQEALTNVVRHASADRANVTLNIGKQEVAVEIVDNGRGAAPQPAAAGHGIAGMRERVTALGGTFKAETVAAGGFRVAARIPVRP